MKKTFFALFAVLLVLSLATCDLLEESDAGRSIAENGMVNLTINIADGGTGRSLTTDLAKADVDYYEVAFKDPTGATMYRKAWNKSDVGPITIAVPVCATPGYNTADKAVLFAGINSTKTLLAVGIITGTTTGGGAVANAVIANNTTAVTFTLSALQNDVATSSFSILGPSAAQTSHPAALHNNYTTTALGKKSVDVGATVVTYPVFSIPEATYPNATVGSFSDTGGNVIGEYTINCGVAGAQNAYYAGVIIETAGWSVHTASYAVTNPPSPIAYPGATIGVTANSIPAAGSAVTGAFRFLIDVSAATNGISKVYIDAPVIAINNTAASGLPGTWHIYGGKDSTDPDAGVVGGTGSDGGAVLLAVGGEELFYLKSIVLNPNFP